MSIRRLGALAPWVALMSSGAAWAGGSPDAATEYTGRAQWDVPLFMPTEAACTDVKSCGRQCRTATTHPYRGSENWLGAAACEKLGDMYADGSASKKSKPSPTIARNSWHAGCMFGNAVACEKEAGFYEVEGSEQSVRHAHAIRSASCRMGDARACDATERMVGQYATYALSPPDRANVHPLPLQYLAAPTVKVDPATVGCGYRMVTVGVPFLWSDPGLAELSGMNPYSHCYEVWIPDYAADANASWAAAKHAELRYRHPITYQEVETEGFMCMGGKPSILVLDSKGRAACPSPEDNEPWYKKEWGEASSEEYGSIAVYMTYTIQRVQEDGEPRMPKIVNVQAIQYARSGEQPQECRPGDCETQYAADYYVDDAGRPIGDALVITIENATYDMPAY